MNIAKLRKLQRKKGMRKIKLFLGACINASQAQCLNCRALAKHLDKSKFIVGARSFSGGDLPIEKLPGVKYFHVRFPTHFWWRVQFLRGLLWCDVAYLPTADHWKWANWVLKFAGKKSFRTIEGVIDGIAYERSIRYFGSREEICRFYESTDRAYAITRFMIDRNRETVGLHEPDGVLYLGTDFDAFFAEKKVHAFTDVILIGADLERKGLSDYLLLARRFHNLRFHVVGGGGWFCSVCSAMRRTRAF